ncbi:alpha/beta hydrolase [Clostridium uliginosum]|uniref:Lysophospholipase n=1 Tax=Clostridium uliginosum TaxID=119641 RepID=A0A1I1M4K2_9CLOT|nr:alpha/beta hydrolase [Clostridium uliginosum]SFC76600.1 lysophospholipase [Clostridium uliginosum]
MENSEFIKSFDGTKLYMVKNLVENPNAIVVIVHGLGEACNRYEYLAKSFNNNNFSTYRFDHRGHGRSDGDKGYYKDFNDLIDDVNFVVDLAKSENKNLPIFLIGHSMGGFGVGAFGTKYPNKVTGIITTGGLTRDTGHAIDSIPVGLDPHTYMSNDMTDMICTDKAVVEAYRSDPLVLKEISAGLYYELGKGIKWLIENKECFKDPVLILHGKDDKLISCQDSKDFFASISSVDKQIKIYDNLYHEILNEPCRDNIISYISDWIKLHL